MRTGRSSGTAALSDRLSGLYFIADVNINIPAVRIACRDSVTVIDNAVVAVVDRSGVLAFDRFIDLDDRTVCRRDDRVIS